MHSSAYSAEKAALEAALKWLESENDWHRAVIVCDCKSLVEATGNPHQADPTIVTLQRSIAKIICSKKLLIVRVHGHCNLWGNELADSEAKRGSTLPQPAERHLDQKTRKAVIHWEDRPLPSSYYRFLDLYTTNTNKIKENTLKKAELTDLVRFRSGHNQVSADGCTSQEKQSQTSVDSVRKRSNQPNISGSNAQLSQGPASATISGPPRMNLCAFHNQL